jgi:mono/diheme cytochrome c family protein
MGKLLLILATLLPILVPAACESTGAAGYRDDGRAPAAEPGTPAAEGRALYVESCQRCHALYRPGNFTAQEWSFFVRKYGRKARLDQAERDLVYAYLRTHAR